MSSEGERSAASDPGAGVAAASTAHSGHRGDAIDGGLAASAATAAGGTAVTLPPGYDLAGKIASLKKQQAQFLAEKKQVTKELKNAERKRRRLKDRARGLSDADLAAVIAMRAYQDGEKAREAGKDTTEPDAGGEVPTPNKSSSSTASPGSIP